MSGFRARVDVSRWVGKLQSLPRELEREVTRRLQFLAEQLVAVVESGSLAQRRQRVTRSLDWQFRAIFVPVTLLHKRREQWPDLHTIYKARILRGQKTYQGRKRFYVDEIKEAALYSQLLSSAMRRRTGQRYTVRFARTFNGRVRIEIIKHGRFAAGEFATIITFARTNVRPVAKQSFAAALERCGLR